MALRLELENGDGSAEFSKDRLYAQERIQELLPAFSPGSTKAFTTVSPDVWTTEGSLRG